MLGRAGMCHYFSWLGTVVLLAVGCMKECMGVTSLAQTSGFWKGSECLSHCAQHPLLGVKALFPFPSNLEEEGWVLWGEGGVSGRGPWPGKSGRDQLRFSLSELRLN